VDKICCGCVLKMANKIKKDFGNAKSRKAIDDKVQLHIVLPRSQYSKIKVVMKILGYMSISELVRENFRKILADAELALKSGGNRCKEGGEP
jgi:hypothetical protein